MQFIRWGVSKILILFIDDYKNVRKNKKILNYKKFTENDYKIIGESFLQVQKSMDL